MDNRLKFYKLPLNGCFLGETEEAVDNRGSFSRIYCFDEFKKIELKSNIVQTNISFTKNKGTIRGLHFQYPPVTEDKIIFCLKGEIFDVIVDIRKNSESFLKWHGEILSNKKMIYIPKGFAHGFQTLTNNVELLYFHTERYSVDHEGSISYKEPKISIDWKIKTSNISEKDKNIKYLDNNFRGIEIGM